MIEFILKWIGGGVLKTVLGHLERRAEQQLGEKKLAADLAAEEIRAEIRAREDARKVLVAETGYFFSAARLGRLIFILPLGLWWAAVCLDSVFHFGWRIAEVPVLRDWGGAIITSLFLVDGVRSVARSVAVRLGR